MIETATATSKFSFSKTDSLCLKGIAIVMMCFHHGFREEWLFKDYTVSFAPFSMDTIMSICQIFKICVCIFAFITGYGLYLSAKDTCNDLKTSEKWIMSRLIKTLSAFWMIYILSFILTWIYASYPQEIYCKNGYIRAIVYALIDFLGLANLCDTPTLLGTWWYMSAAIIFIVLIPIAIKFSNKFGYISLIICVAALPRILKTDYPGNMSTYPFIMVVVFGMIFAHYNLFKKLDNVKLTDNKVFSDIIQFMIYAFLVVGGGFVYLKVPIETLWEYNYAVYPVIVICFCNKFIVRIPIIRNVLAFLGKHSVNIFLVHTFIRYTFFGEFIYSFKHFVLITVVLLLISLGISIVVEALKKLIRYNKLISTFSDKVCAVVDKL